MSEEKTEATTEVEKPQVKQNNQPPVKQEQVKQQPKQEPAINAYVKRIENKLDEITTAIVGKDIPSPEEAGNAHYELYLLMMDILSLESIQDVRACWTVLRNHINAYREEHYNPNDMFRYVQYWPNDQKTNTIYRRLLFVLVMYTPLSLKENQHKVNMTDTINMLNSVQRSNFVELYDL